MALHNYRPSMEDVTAKSANSRSCAWRRLAATMDQLCEEASRQGLTNTVLKSLLADDPPQRTSAGNRLTTT